HVGDDDVVERHLFERHLGMLRVDDTMLEARVRHADRDVAERVVDVAARDHHRRVPQQKLAHTRVEENGGHRSHLRLAAAASLVRLYEPERPSYAFFNVARSSLFISSNAAMT